jgi:hypothetical protein
VQQIRLLTTTALMTIFIWVSADQLLREEAELPVVFTVRAGPNSDIVIDKSPDTPDTFLVTVSGRKRDIAALREGGTLKINITVNDDAFQGRTTGSLSLSLRDELRANPSYLTGYDIKHVKPPNIIVNVDRLIDVNVPVRLLRGGLDYAVDPVVDPPNVDVRVLQSVYDRIASANPRVLLDLADTLLDRPEGEALKVSVPLIGEILTDRETLQVAAIEPETVTIRTTLRSRLKQGTINAVPIKFQASRTVYDRFNIEFRDENPPETIRIDVRGVPEQVDRLVSGELKTAAVIVLISPSGVDGGDFQFYTPRFDLPDGIELLNERELPTIEIRLSPRTTNRNEP